MSKNGCTEELWHAQISNVVWGSSNHYVRYVVGMLFYLSSEDKEVN